MRVTEGYSQVIYGSFPKTGVPFEGSLKGLQVFWGLYWGPLILGNYHMEGLWGCKGSIYPKP